jgi:hypothetical protein
VTTGQPGSLDGLFPAAPPTADGEGGEVRGRALGGARAVAVGSAMRRPSPARGLSGSDGDATALQQEAREWCDAR